MKSNSHLSSIFAVSFLLVVLFVFGFTHISLIRQEDSLRFGRRAQQLEDQINLLMKKQNQQPFENLDSDIRLQSSIAPFDSSSFMLGISDPQSQNFKLARELSFRYNIRYWLETKPFWSKSFLPVKEKFLTFEPWGGGFNNIRMSLEMAAAMAIALNRTLVLPPVGLITPFDDITYSKLTLFYYFDFEDLRRGISSISYQEFRDKVNLNAYDGLGASIPSTNQISRAFDGLHKMPRVKILREDSELIKRKIGSQIVFCFPHCPSKSEWFSNVQYRLHPIDTGLHPEIFEDPHILHFGPMLLGHFYTMVWFENPQRGQEVKRKIRDHIHFHEEMFALAERIIKELGGDFSYSCLHVRRNDFQFEEAWTPAEQIISNVGPLFSSDETIYISTDELSLSKEQRNKVWSDPLAMSKIKEHAWFEPMKRAWKSVKFWSDFHESLQLDKDVRKIWIGSVESIVCSRGRKFVSTRKSTFSGYIHRMRGYMHDVGQKEYLEAQSKFPEDYYKSLVGPSWSRFPHGAFGGGHPYWGREYKESWEGVYDPFY